MTTDRPVLAADDQDIPGIVADAAEPLQYPEDHVFEQDQASGEKGKGMLPEGGVDLKPGEALQ